MDINDQALITLKNVIREMIRQEIKNLDFNDKTHNGTIKEVLTNNNYLVEIQGSYYTLSDTNSHSVGDIVEIFVPCNNWDKMRISN